MAVPAKVSRQFLAWMLSRSAGLLMILFGLASFVGLYGCGGTPQERYRTLSIFFDGVPNPDAPARARNDAAGRPTVAGARIVSVHKPYVNNQCAACHNAPNGDVQDFALAYNACVKCHKNIPTERALMHGPVALAQCKWCHAPHQSTELNLLKDTPIKVCTQCHDKQLLSNNPPEHTDGTTSCLQCHFAHGGTARYFIKSPAATAPVVPTQVVPTPPSALRDPDPGTPFTIPAQSTPATTQSTAPALNLPRKESAP